MGVHFLAWHSGLKHPVLLQLQCRLQLQLRPRNFYMPQVWPFKKKKKEEEECLFTSWYRWAGSFHMRDLFSAFKSTEKGQCPFCTS